MGYISGARAGKVDVSWASGWASWVGASQSPAQRGQGPGPQPRAARPALCSRTADKNKLPPDGISIQSF